MADDSLQLDEELVAYLDGELSGEAARRVDERLAVDERWFGAIAAAVVSALVGYAAIAWTWPSTNDRLLADLPVVEQFEFYRSVPDIEFLRQLRELMPLRDQQAGTLEAAEPAAVAGFPDPLAQTPDARSYVEGLRPDQREALARRFEKFTALPAEEQQRLRALQSELSVDPDRDELWQTLVRYHEWLTGLSPGERADLAELPPDKRLERVKQMLDDQETRLAVRLGAGRLMPGDARAILEWMEDVAVARRDEILSSLPEHRRQWIAGLDEIPQRRHLLVAGWQLWGVGGNSGPPIDQEELQSLLQKLSPDARAALTTVPANRRLRAARELAQAAVRARLWSTGGFAFGASVSRDELRNVFEQLSPSERARLEALPSEEMQQHLRRRYYQRRWGEGPGRDGPWRDGSGRDGPARDGSPRGGPSAEDDPRPRREPGMRLPPGPPGERPPGPPPARDDRPRPPTPEEPT
jgi:hypothetical protein